MHKRALITGATSGIGAAFAEELPIRTDLLLTGRNEERLSKARERLARNGRTVETLAADLTDEKAVSELIARADDFGIDLLINNAGTGRLGRVIDNPPEVERNTIMLNVLAVTVLTRGLLPGMLARARTARRPAGLIIVSSATAFAPVPYFAAYAASKAFDLHFAEALAEELRDEPIHVLALCPGATKTAFGDHAGFDPGNLPGATDPRSVARGALRALGRETVHVSGLINQATLGPLVMPRRLVTGALGVAMRFLSPRVRAS